jgi:hypothetical protein
VTQNVQLCQWLLSRSELVTDLCMIDDCLRTRLSSTGSQIQSHQDSVKKIQDFLSKRETALEAPYTHVYGRYLVEFSCRQAIDTQMK